jgi:hypothetical protein
VKERQVISNSRKPIVVLADDVIALSKQGNSWSRGAGALQFMRDFERHSDNPEAFEELVAALEERGGSSMDLILLPLAELAFIPLVVMRQHAVGHGGFHTGAMGRGSARLRWVYDCGASRSEGLQRLSDEIDILAGEPRDAKRRVDLLFISHFDRDHVSGIVKLMSAVEVDTVVIPYLDDLQRAIIFVSEMADVEEENGSVDPRLIQALFDPVPWLTELGAKRVIQVRAGGPGFDGSRILSYGPGDGPRLPEDVDGVQPVLIRQNDNAVNEVDDCSVVDSGSGWMVTHFGRRFGDWCFLPYVTPARQSALDVFRTVFRKLLELLEGESMVAAFHRKMKEEGFAAKVKDAYKKHELGDANAVSMSLYVGPFRDGVWCSRKPLRAGQEWHKAGPGWLLTGDAKLAQVNRRNDWLSFYKPLKSRIGALMLPHHGSHLNFHEDILDVVEKDCLLFACRRAKLGEPLHENVWTVVERRPVAIVSDDRKTSLMQVSGATVLEHAERDLSDLTEEWC